MHANMRLLARILHATCHNKTYRVCTIFGYGLIRRFHEQEHLSMECLSRFDVGWEHGLSMLICDYIFEVCSDPRLTSADPMQSHLLDGRCVADWACGALQRLRARLHQVPARSASLPGASPGFASPDPMPHLATTFRGSPNISVHNPMMKNVMCFVASVPVQWAAPPDSCG